MSQELDALLARVYDDALRDDLRRAIDAVRAKRTFGLVFERHLPERVTLPSHPVRRGAKVVRRDGGSNDDSGGGVLVVRSVRNGVARLTPMTATPAAPATSTPPRSRCRCATWWWWPSSASPSTRA